MTGFDRLSSVAATTAALAGIVWASHAPMTVHASTNAMLRLAWSALPERIETCRERSHEELEHLPEHMRQRLECVGAAAHYRLSVRLGDRLVASRILQAGGLRQDRRIYVLSEFEVAPGDVDVAIQFERVETPDGGRAMGGLDRRQSAETLPARLAFVERVRFQPRAVVLVTYDPEREQLKASGDSAPATR